MFSLLGERRVNSSIIGISELKFQEESRIGDVSDYLGGVFPCVPL